MGFVLSIIKTVAPFVLLGAIGAYYVYNPRQPRRAVRGASLSSLRAPEPVAAQPKAKRGAARAGKGDSIAVPSGELAPPLQQRTMAIPGALFDTQLDDHEATHSQQRSAASARAADTASDTGAELSSRETAAAAKKKRKPVKKATLTPAAPGPAAVPVPAPASVDDLLQDGPWTRVERASKKSTTVAKERSTKRSGSPSISSSGLTTEEDADTAQTAATASASAVVPSAAEPEQQTLAERLIPRAPRTKVDDMLETPQDPSLARVMRIAPGPGEIPATGSWGDYEDVSTEDVGTDDGFTPVVKARSKQRIARQPSDLSTSSSSAPAVRSSDAQTKKQRQNALKKELQKGEKQALEAERLATLAKHRQDRKMDEIYSTGGRSTLSGNQKAGVDENFKLHFSS
ncbi:hypothetical protein BKA62DRAFT_688831 [Auriculariales sp. MPI-PUGE-AT-0066]|nr:hypothetical protein BKA62DRAFT_688831 [Auriculariales sp. MPI-PUGE-AT-0066]